MESNLFKLATISKRKKISKKYRHNGRVYRKIIRKYAYG